MSYTLDDLKKMVMDVVGEDSSNPTYWTSTNDAELVDYINDAIQEVMYNFPIQVTFYVPLVAGKSHYHLTPESGFIPLKLVDVRLGSTQHQLDLTHPYTLSREDYHWMARTGQPRKFYLILPNTIRVVPTPEIDGDVLECLVECLPKRYTYNDEKVDVPDEYISLVIDYASYLVFLSLRDYDKASFYLKNFSEVAPSGSTMTGAIKLLSMDNAIK